MSFTIEVPQLNNPQDSFSLTLNDGAKTVKALSEMEKSKLVFKPPRFERNCNDWPMCMCQKQCAKK